MHHHSDPTRSPWTAPGRYGPSPAVTTMRVSDADRTEVTDALTRHFADGRLDQAELDDRVNRALAAKTQADLAPLLTDLPPLDGAAPAPRPARRGRLPWKILVGAILSLVLVGRVASSAAHLHLDIPWLVVLPLVWLLVHRSRRHRRHPHPH